MCPHVLVYLFNLFYLSKNNRGLTLILLIQNVQFEMGAVYIRTVDGVLGLLKI
jgi:hypothetical protein